MLISFEKTIYISLLPDEAKKRTGRACKVQVDLDDEKNDRTTAKKVFEQVLAQYDQKDLALLFKEATGLSLAVDVAKELSNKMQGVSMIRLWESSERWIEINGEEIKALEKPEKP